MLNGLLANDASRSLIIIILCLYSLVVFFGSWSGSLASLGTEPLATGDAPDTADLNFKFERFNGSRCPTLSMSFGRRSFGRQFSAPEATQAMLLERFYSRCYSKEATQKMLNYSRDAEMSNAGMFWSRWEATRFPNKSLKVGNSNSRIQKCRS